MSKIKLGNINYNKSIYEPDFYVASIVNSNSGCFIPKLITDKSDIVNIFGKFNYYQLYENIVSNGIPVVLTPVITPVSEYNRSSLRLNDNNSVVDYCHPRYKKNYDYVALAEFKTNEVVNDNSIVINTGSKYPIPYSISYSSGNDESDFKEEAVYSQVDGKWIITINFNYKVNAIVTTEYYEDLDNDKFCKSELEFNNLGNLTLPEIVPLDSSGKLCNINDVTEILENGIIKLSYDSSSNIDKIYSRITPD